MRIVFFTLFDSGYAARGLVLLGSIERFRRPGDEVVVLALDVRAGALLRNESQGRWRVLEIADLGDDQLLEARNNRPFREFCWTATPAMSSFMVQQARARDVVVYLDADMMFFADPRIVIEELGEAGSVLIHEHRYAPDRMAWLPTSGRFNVGLVAFRACEEARKCVTRWREQTLLRCDLDPENGQCGDQGYLNEWPDLYPNLKVMRHIGGCVAPWNVGQYKVTSEGGVPRVDGVPVIFYHYHALKTVVWPKLGLLAAEPAFGYDFVPAVHDILYRPYLRALRGAIGRLRNSGETITSDRVMNRHELKESLGKRRVVAATRLALAVSETARISRPAIKKVLRGLTPPMLWEAMHRLRPSALANLGKLSHEQSANGSVAKPTEAPETQPEWEMVENSDAVWTTHQGWAHDSIATLQKEKWGSFLASVVGVRSLGQSHEAARDAPIDDTIHNMIMTFGYAIGRALTGKTSLSLLDWGGGAGHYAIYARSLYPDVAFDYTVYDLPTLCQVGRELVDDVNFLDDAESALGRRYDLVFASSSIQYSRDVYALIKKLCNAAKDYLMITRSPFVDKADDFVVMQRPYAHGYMTEYPGWFLNRNSFRAYIEAQGFALQREFMLAERPYVPNAPEQCRYEGFLFRRRGTAN